MTEDLERLLHGTEGQPPSAEFVARLRARIVAETEGIHADDETNLEPGPSLVSDDLVVDIGRGHQGGEDGRASRRTGRQWRYRLLTAAAAMIVAVGVWGSTLGSDDPDAELRTLDVPTATEGPELTTDRSGAPLTTDNTFFDAGTFDIDTLGTTFTFSVEGTTGLLVNENGIVALSDLTTRNVDDRTITLRRTAMLPRPSAPTSVPDATSGWPATDLGGWVEALGDGVSASDPVSTTLGGREATFVEFELPCREDDCMPDGIFTRPDLPMFVPGSHYRVWVVEQDQEDPIVVVAAIDGLDDVAWVDQADALLASLDFGAVEPNPVRRVPAGSVELDAFGGIVVQVPGEAVVVEPFDGFARIIPGDIAGDVELLTRPLDADGVEVTTAARLLELLRFEAIEIVELEPVVVGGTVARTIAIDSGSFEKVVLAARVADLSRPEAGWAPPVTGHLWVIEHPERGLLIVSAAAFDRSDLEPLRAWTESLLRTVEFEER